VSEDEPVKSIVQEHRTSSR